MKRTARFISMAWLLAFAMVLVLSPFQALAEGNDKQTTIELNEDGADAGNETPDADREKSPEGEDPAKSKEPAGKAPVSKGKDGTNAEDIKKELAGLEFGVKVTPHVNLGEDGKATDVEVGGSLFVNTKNTFKTQLAKNPFQGTWKFTVKDAEGKEVASKKKQNFNLSASESLNVTDPGKYTAVVEWEAPFGITKVSGEAPFTIEAVEEPREEEPDEEDPGEEAPALPENLDVMAVPEIDEEGFYTGFVKVKGKIAGAKKGDEVTGKWKFVLKDTETGEVVDKAVKKNKKGIRKGAWLAAFESGTYEAKVVFNGTFNGEALKVKGSTELTLEVPEYLDFDHEVKYEYKEGKHRVTASILEGEHATGLWLIGLFDMEGNPVVEPAFVEFHEGKTFTAEFKDKLKPGQYFVGVVFEGTVDGQPGGFIDDSVEFEVKDGKSVTKPGKDDDGKDPVKPGEPKKVIDEIKNGGKMPKTATQYPLGMMVGGGVLLLGLVIFGIMKFRRSTV